MARYCRSCGRPLTDEFHDTGRAAGPMVDGLTASGRPRVAERKHRVYGCRVKLVATSPVSGRTLRPNSPQRIKELDTRYVPEGLDD